jgi:[ribosomal protein S5]-alanine N-acetyltransferase
VTFGRRGSVHPSAQPAAPAVAGLRLYGKRVMMRPLMSSDFPQWTEVRLRNEDWLTKWEPLRTNNFADPTRHRDAFASRCSTRDRERQVGSAYGFGLFVDNAFVGEINVNNVIRGAMQCGTVGYWIDQRHAGNRYVAEGVAVACRFAFDELHLHRLEICIVPRNTNSRRVMDVLAIRDEGVALRYLEINGTWEDHTRYAITAEEWHARREDFAARWG